MLCYAATVPALVVLMASQVSALALPSPQAALKARLRDAEVLSFDDVAHLPKPGTLGLASAKFSPDGSHLTYLASTDQGSMAKALYAYDVAKGETSVWCCQKCWGGCNMTGPCPLRVAVSGSSSAGESVVRRFVDCSSPGGRLENHT